MTSDGQSINNNHRESLATDFGSNSPTYLQVPLVHNVNVINTGEAKVNCQDMVRFGIKVNCQDMVRFMK